MDNHTNGMLDHHRAARYALWHLVGQRFNYRARALVYARSDDDGTDVTLYQVLGDKHEVLWNALPDVHHDIPAWHQLGDAVEQLADVVFTSPDRGDLLVHRLVDPRARWYMPVERVRA